MPSPSSAWPKRRSCAASTRSRAVIAGAATRALGLDLGRLWGKRDDCTGPATRRDKARRLEILVAVALATGCDALVTVGESQSRQARITAAAAAHSGLGPCSHTRHAADAERKRCLSARLVTADRWRGKEVKGPISYSNRSRSWPASRAPATTGARCGKPGCSIEAQSTPNRKLRSPGLELRPNVETGAGARVGGFRKCQPSRDAQPGSTNSS